MAVDTPVFDANMDSTGNLLVTSFVGRDNEIVPILAITISHYNPTHVNGHAACEIILVAH